ncbi:MAG TPA: N-acetyl-gamma-glutamyl-phosphate reductase [Candidatus Goldiibacteriota bacterium]|nr:N-acetyl-gamma-glutamyl-phosphate reductase [Candidatus Goldiibacteriota bacterium]
MIKAGIIGGSGLTGKELIKILSKHKEVKITKVTSVKSAGTRITGLFPDLKGLIDGNFLDTSDAAVFNDIDIAFICLPNVEAMSYVNKAMKKGLRVIDLSADFRIKNPSLYRKYYKVEHKYKNLLKKSVYGLTELFRDQIADSDLIANPGCFATSILLGIYPAIKNYDIETIIVDAKTGISGAGIAPTPRTHYLNVNENVLPYDVGKKHRHLGEIEDVIFNSLGKKTDIIFTPQIVSLNRGILSVNYVKLRKRINTETVKKTYEKFYANSSFIRFTNSPDLHNVQNTNYCDVYIEGIPESKILIIITLIDNLVKGASGQAVQNMNVMYGFQETEALK